MYKVDDKFIVSKPNKLKQIIKPNLYSVMIPIIGLITQCSLFVIILINDKIFSGISILERFSIFLLLILFLIPIFGLVGIFLSIINIFRRAYIILNIFALLLNMAWFSVIIWVIYVFSNF